MLTKFRSKCTELYSQSLSESKRLQHTHVGVEHVALALLSDPVYPLNAALKQICFYAKFLFQSFEKLVGTGIATSSTPLATLRLTATPFNCLFDEGAT
jgi:hypothetical protein